ncbi:hypothetical protein CPAR01_08027 [Colletotrichum paranaense]|uniref:Uncharacterized protein n=1 Tax=Colletotrichum paranaense TaxID=1914294 RepID=A0ABQ9SJA8_9PEZI|nr:uncharacterized protein CPAR01_08027 [Colletotrichum paranaense]KAK1537914.1 hypothetical protein CPAR01_08027 [Colletotrichum paranaense]
MAPVKVPSALCHEGGPGIVDSSGEGGLVWTLDDSEKKNSSRPPYESYPSFSRFPSPYSL